MRLRSTVRLKAWLCCLAAALASSAPVAALTPIAAAPQQQAQQKPSRPPTRYIRGHDFDTRHISLDLRFDWERERVIGTARITLAPLLSELRRAELDAAEMTFSSVRLDSGAPLKFEADAKGQRLIVTLDRVYRRDETLTLVIDYQTNGVAEGAAPNSGPRPGIRFVKPSPRDRSKPRQLWSHGQPEYSHYWFPCHDHPNDFTTTEITATVARPAIVISNGRLLKTKENRDGTRTFHWKMEQPHATYLTSIVVGEFTPIETAYAGIPVVTYVRPEQLEVGKVTAARVGEMIKFFSERTGLRYPYAGYSQTFVSDFENIGGMENITASTITDQILQDERAQLDQSSDGLQVHEAAHQWFGNYVTPRTWADVWLSEGFAVYMQALWDGHLYGREDFLNRVRRNQHLYHVAWANGAHQPLANRNYERPDDNFNLNTYRGGAVVLDMLRATLGEENWWRAVRHFIGKHAHQPVQTEQFRIAIEEATGQPLDWFFDQWVYGAGFPSLRVKQSYDPRAKTLTLNVRQEQKPDPDSGLSQARLFRAYADVTVGTAAGTRVERIHLEPKEEQSFTFAADSRPLLVNFDRGGTIFKKLEFEKSVDELIYQLAHDDDLIGRAWALGHLAQRLKDAATAEADRKKISAAFAETVLKDPFWNMRTDAAGSLAGMSGDAVARAALLAATKDKDARVRSAATAALRAVKDPSLAGVYEQLLSDPSYATARTAALALGETGSPGAFDPLVRMLGVASWKDTLRISALNGLGLLGDKRALEIGVRYASVREPTPVRSAALLLVGSVGKDDASALALLSGELLNAVAAGDGDLINAAAQALVNLGDPSAAEVFSRAREKTSDPQVKTLLAQSEERLRQNGRQARPKTTGS